MHLDIVHLWIVIGFLILPVYSKTKSDDVSALNVMYTSLNSPSELSNWKSSGGDPCDDSWKGIKCSGNSVTEIYLSDLGLSGSMGYQLANLKSVKVFDLSRNKLKGDIPYQLPPNLETLDLSENEFTGSVPYSISQMTQIQNLNLARNKLSNQLSDVFAKLTKLKKMDVSHNSLSGNLPQSMEKLSSIKTLDLQNNKLTGSINVLAPLPLENLNVANNRFTGWISPEVQSINNLDTGGNSWSTGPAPPPPPGTKTIHKLTNKSGPSKKSIVGGVIIAAIGLGVLMLIALTFILLARRRRSTPSSHFLDEEGHSQRRTFTPLASQELTTDGHPNIHKDFTDPKIFDSPTTIDIKPLQKSPSIGQKTSSSTRAQSLSDSEFAKRLSASRSTSVRFAAYTLADLQSTTANFAPSRLIGEGSIGRVYRAKYSDGKVLAVKKIDSSLFQGRRTEEFTEIVAKISKLDHPNIAELFGFCLEQGHHMLVYEYFRNGSLHEFLHAADDYSNPLTWNTRVRIALGAARGVEYLHEICSPCLIHKNIKSTNILLDMELNPHISDYGLATFHQRTSQNLGLGYNAPECTTPSAYTVKSDVYSFGVVMLELLTGRMPFDSTKAKAEQCLVRWASPLLHDLDALGRMVDPALRGLYPPKSLSRFADIIALCVQSEPEFRPPLSEVVQALVRLVQRSSMNVSKELGASRRSDDYDD